VLEEVVTKGDSGERSGQLLNDVVVSMKGNGDERQGQLSDDKAPSKGVVILRHHIC